MVTEMAHVDSSKSKDLTIFLVFDRLFKSAFNKEKTCASLVDVLKDKPGNVGATTSAAYTAKRLVRGLSASDSEKQNTFFSSLCTLLAAEVVTPADALTALRSVAANAGTSNDEQTSAHVSAILTYGALALAEKTLALPSEDQVKLLETLLLACNSKQYIKGAASAFLLEIISECSKTFAKNLLLPAIKQIIDNQKKLEPEFVVICGVAYLTHKKSIQKLIDEKFGDRKKFLEDVATSASHFPQNRQDEIIKLICVDLSLSGKGKAIAQLWLNVINTENKAHPAWNAYLLLFAKMIFEISPDAEMLADCIHPKLIDLLIKSLQVHVKKGSGGICYERGSDALATLVARVAGEENKSKIALTIIQKILAEPGCLLFDKKTKSSTLQLLMACLDSGSTTLLAEELVKMVNENVKKSKNVKDLPLIVTLLTKILSHVEARKDLCFASKYINYIFDLAFSKSLTRGDVKSKITDIFYKAIELSHMKLGDAVVVLNNIVAHADSSLSQLTSNWSENSRDQWKNMLTVNQKMGSKSSDKYVAVRVLLLQMGLRMFRDENMASSTIEELLQCYQEIKKRKSDLDLNGQPHWVEVTVDLLLALLSRENKMLRNVVASVFPSITPYLTATALQQIIDALDPSSRNDVLKHVDSDDSDDDMEGSEDDDDANDFDEEVEEEVDEDSAGSGEEDEEETVNDKLRMAVRNALGYSAALTDDEDVDMDEMNADEETRLNESLSNAFRLFRPSKGSKKKQGKDDEALMHFRIRVLDLVEIVLTNSPPLSSCVELLEPLFVLLDTSIKDAHQKPLQNRLESVLKKLGAVKKFGNESDVTYRDVVSAMKRLFERDTSAMISAEMAPWASECSVMLVRAAQHVPSDGEEPTIEAIFASLLARYLDNDRKIPYSLFQQILRMLWDGNWHLSETIMTNLLNPDIKIYKKIKLVELLDIFYRNDRLQSTATDDCKKRTCQFESKFVKKLSKVLAENSNRRTNLLPAFYHRLVLLVQLAAQSRTKYRENCTPVPNWQLVIAQLVDQLHLLPQQKARNKLFQLAQQFNVPLPSKEELKKLKTISQDGERKQTKDKKRKPIEEVEITEDVSEPINSKKRKVRESGHKKKESKERRYLLSGEGLEEVSFSALDKAQLNEDEDEPVLKKSKKSPVAENSHKKKNKA